MLNKESLHFIVFCLKFKDFKQKSDYFKNHNK